MLIALVGTAVVMLLVLVVACVRWWATRTVEEDVEVGADVAVEPVQDAVVRQLPVGHRPPPGLGPLSPSERFLGGEVERGLRELQAYLLDTA